MVLYGSNFLGNFLCFKVLHSYFRFGHLTREHPVYIQGEIASIVIPSRRERSRACHRGIKIIEYGRTRCSSIMNDKKSYVISFSSRKYFMFDFSRIRHCIFDRALRASVVSVVRNSDAIIIGLNIIQWNIPPVQKSLLD